MANAEACKPISRAWNQSHRERVRASAAAYTEREYRPTLEQATRLWQPWTGPEIKLLDDVSLSVKQIALMIGRTTHAVRAARKRYRLAS